MNKSTSERVEIQPTNLTHMEKLAAIGQLASGVAHEMRNLLGMIRTAAFNIDRALTTHDPTIQRNLEIINRSVARAREFIDNLLDLSRQPRGTVETLNVVELVDTLLQLFSKELEWRQITLERYYEEIPNYPLDRNALQECILNLILNAIQSMENGGTITVTIKPWQNGVQIIISHAAESHRITGKYSISFLLPKRMEWEQDSD